MLSSHSFFFKLNFDGLNVFPQELAFERSEDDPPEIEIYGDEVNLSRSPDEGTSKDAPFESDSSSDNDMEIRDVKHGVPSKCRKIE